MNRNLSQHASNGGGPIKNSWSRASLPVWLGSSYTNCGPSSNKECQPVSWSGLCHRPGGWRSNAISRSQKVPDRSEFVRCGACVSTKSLHTFANSPPEDQSGPWFSIRTWRISMATTLGTPHASIFGAIPHHFGHGHFFKWPCLHHGFVWWSYSTPWSEWSWSLFLAFAGCSSSLQVGQWSMARPNHSCCPGESAQVGISSSESCEVFEDCHSAWKTDTL